MSDRFCGLHGHITAAAAEAERDRLFDRPRRPLSPETRALFKRLDWRAPHKLPPEGRAGIEITKGGSNAHT